MTYAGLGGLAGLCMTYSDCSLINGSKEFDYKLYENFMKGAVLGWAGGMLLASNIPRGGY